MSWLVQCPAPKWVTSVKDAHIEAMEKALNVWVEDNAQKNVPLSGPLIRGKAKRMYDHLTGTCGAAYTGDEGTSDVATNGPSPFQASRGWFDRFKKWDGLHNV